MLEVKNIDPIKPSDKEYNHVESLCASLRIDAAAARTALRCAHKELNHEDFEKSLMLYIERLLYKSKRYADQIVASQVLTSRFYQINAMTPKACILTGFAANNLLFHTMCLNYGRSVDDVGEMLEEALQESFCVENHSCGTLITPEKINRVISDLDIVYPGFRRLIENSNTIFAIIDTYNKNEDGSYTKIMIDNQGVKEPRSYIFLFKPFEENTAETVLVHELCHLLLEEIEENSLLQAKIDKTFGMLANLEKAANDGMKEEVLCTLVTHGVLQNETFNKMEYRDARWETLHKRYEPEHAEALMKITNSLLEAIIEK